MNWIITSRDSRSPREFGGTPFSLIHGFLTSGVQASGINLYPWWIKYVLKNCWRIYRICIFKSPIGFQYTNFANILRGIILRQINVENDKLVSFSQIVPDTKCNFVIYTDCSVTYLFNNYPETSRVPADLRSVAIKLEHDSYQRAKYIFLKTLDSIEDIHLNYNVPREKLIYLPVPPNNRIKLDGEKIRKRIENIANQVNFVFIGKDPYRKGLDRALETISFLQRNGVHCRLDVVGVDPKRYDLVNANNVFFHGRLQLNSPKLLDILEKSHFGFLLSRSEAAGISSREFQAAGIIPIVSDIPSVLQGIVVRNYLVCEGNSFDSKFYSKILTFLESENLKIVLEEAFSDSHLIENWQSTSQKIEKVLSNL